MVNNMAKSEKESMDRLLTLASKVGTQRREDYEEAVEDARREAAKERRRAARERKDAERKAEMGKWLGLAGTVLGAGVGFLVPGGTAISAMIGSSIGGGLGAAIAPGGSTLPLQGGIQQTLGYMGQREAMLGDRDFMKELYGSRNSGPSLPPTQSTFSRDLPSWTDAFNTPKLTLGG